MAYPLGPIATQDNYSANTTRETQECARLDIFVSNAPIYYQLYQDGQWSTEHYIPSATNQTYFLSLDRILSGLRVRSAVAGNPSTVVAQLIPQSEIPSG